MTTAVASSTQTTKTIPWRRDIFHSLGWAVIGLFAGLLAGNYQIQYLDPETLELIASQLGSTEVLAVISAVQVMFLTFISALFGARLSRKVGLHLTTLFDLKTIGLVLTVGLAGALLIGGSDRFLFSQYLPGETTYTFSFLYLATGVLYGGIIEELLIRYFLMTLIVVLLQKLKLKDTAYWTAILLSSLIFAAAHLPATAMTTPLTGLIVFRAFLLNTPPGIAFGWLFWKKGLFASMAAHIALHIIGQMLIYPLLF